MPPGGRIAAIGPDIAETFDSARPDSVGGVGTVAGPVLGGLLYALVREQLAVTLVQAYRSDFGVLFIVVVLALPGGLVDLRTRARLPWSTPATLDEGSAPTGVE